MKNTQSYELVSNALYTTINYVYEIYEKRETNMRRLIVVASCLKIKHGALCMYTVVLAINS